MNGWVGKILHANLSNAELTQLPIQPYAARSHGGRALASRNHWEVMTPKSDPWQFSKDDEPVDSMLSLMPQSCPMTIQHARWQAHLVSLEKSAVNSKMRMTPGGAIRVGLEDNLMQRKGQPAQSNAQLVTRTVKIDR